LTDRIDSKIKIPDFEIFEFNLENLFKIFR